MQLRPVISHYFAIKKIRIHLHYNHPICSSERGALTQQPPTSMAILSWLYSFQLLHVSTSCCLGKYWNHYPWEHSQNMQMQPLATRFNGEHGSARLTVGLSDLWVIFSTSNNSGILLTHQLRTACTLRLKHRCHWHSSCIEPNANTAS